MCFAMLQRWVTSVSLNRRFELGPRDILCLAAKIIYIGSLKQIWSKTHSYSVIFWVLLHEQARSLAFHYLLVQFLLYSHIIATEEKCFLYFFLLKFYKFLLGYICIKLFWFSFTDGCQNFWHTCVGTGLSFLYYIKLLRHCL